MTTTQIVLASRPIGLPTLENFRLETAELPEIQENEVLLSGLYYSVDPYMRGRMNKTKSYAAYFEIDAPVVGAAVATVLESKSDKFVKGDTVTGLLPWSMQAVVKESIIRKIDTSIAPASYYLGILGMPGQTAYFGLLDIGKPKAAETVVISAAAGAVGMVVGQIARIRGCKVVGIAGDDTKNDILKNEFGFDAVINYKTTENLDQAIADACPEGVDIYFDNVGGEISDAVIRHLNFHARIPLCGQISLYNSTSIPIGPRVQLMMVSRSVLMQGFIVGNYHKRFDEANEQLAAWVTSGALTYKETIIEGFQKLPEALLLLFSGGNIGKVVVKV